MLVQILPLTTVSWTLAAGTRVEVILARRVPVAGFRELALVVRIHGLTVPSGAMWTVEAQPTWSARGAPGADHAGPPIAWVDRRSAPAFGSPELHLQAAALGSDELRIVLRGTLGATVSALALSASINLLMKE